jgi:hypothetical protein
MRFYQLTVVCSQICDSDRSDEGVYFQSNRGHRFTILRWRFNANWTVMFTSKQSGGDAKWPRRSLGHCSSELGLGGVMACGFQRGGALDEQDLKGNSPRLLWVSRGWRLGLATVAAPLFVGGRLLSQGEGQNRVTIHCRCSRASQWSTRCYVSAWQWEF